jgi:hypothetical protein
MFLIHHHHHHHHRRGGGGGQQMRCIMGGLHYGKQPKWPPVAANFNDGPTRSLTFQRAVTEARDGKCVKGYKFRKLGQTSRKRWQEFEL